MGDYISEPILIALALLGASKRRIQTKYVEEISPRGKLVRRFLVRAYQGQMNRKLTHVSNKAVDLWRVFPPQDAVQLLVVHGTGIPEANQIMGPNGSMRPKKNRGFHHFAHATNTTTLDQTD